MKLLMVSLCILLTTVSAWLAADFYLFREQKAEHEVLIKKIADRTCIYNELVKIEKYRFDSILNAELEALRRRIPQIGEASNVFALLTKIADESHVVLGDFQAEKTQFRLTLSASFPNLINFLEKIAAQERLMVVKNLKYGFGEAKIELSAYFENLNLKPQSVLLSSYHCGEVIIPANIDAILAIPQSQHVFQKSVQDPFIIPENLTLSGVVELGNQWLALLENEKSEGRVVKVGDTLMQDFRVRKINQSSVLLSNATQTKKLSWSDLSLSHVVLASSSAQKLTFVEFRHAKLINVLKLIETQGKIRIPKTKNPSLELSLRLEDVSWVELLKIINRQVNP